MRFLLRFAINVVALLAIANYFPGITLASWRTALLAAVIFGLVNAIIRPLIKIVSLPLMILTLGLFSLVINAVLFWLIALFLPGFEVASFMSAFWGALAMSAVSWVSGLVLKR